MPTIDPSLSVVVFEVAVAGQLQKLSRPGEAKAADSVRRAWEALASEASLLPAAVKRIYSEWEPSLEDQAFINTTFPGIQVTYSFHRPPADEWERALQAEQIIRSKVEAPDTATTAKADGKKKPWQFWK